ncbi:hypothetical protein ACN0TX_12000 [Staphylococcus cohnii]|uniref:hypothetical protein n=1 Tax=Staphylococcus cohnii TaxID=29382 RepID=UPI003AF77B03
MLIYTLIAIIILTTIVNIGFMLFFIKENKKTNRVRNERYKRFIEGVKEMNTFKKPY